MTMQKVELKECSRCNVQKELTEFYNNNRYHCIECERESARKRMRSRDNRIRTALRDSKRTAEKHGAYDDLTEDDLRYLFYLADEHCAYSGQRSDNLSVDHIIPFSEGGANTLSNILIVDKTLNMQKGSRNPSEFIERHAGFYVTDDIIRLIAARRGEDYEKVSREFFEAQREYNNEIYRKLVGDRAD